MEGGTLGNSARLEGAWELMTGKPHAEIIGTFEKSDKPPGNAYTERGHLRGTSRRENKASKDCGFGAPL